MTTVQAGLTYYKQVNEQIRAAQDSEITVENVIGQRYIGCGSTDRKITVHGTAGNGLGAYPVNNFCGTGMHGGKIVLRCDKAPTDLPRQVLVSEVSEDDMTEFAPYIKEYAQLFGADAENLLSQKYFVLTPNPEAGYKQLYTFEA